MSLELIIGCMFSGKSSEIIRITRRLNTINQKYLLIKPIIDVRYSKDKVSTHDDIHVDCLIVDRLHTIYKNTLYKESQYIIIDEGQFFTGLHEFVVSAVEKHNKNVIVVGLDGDSNRNNFGEIHKLIPICDSIKKKKALCFLCKDGTEAIFSKRILDSKDQINVGSKDKYLAVCRNCFLK